MAFGLGLGGPVVCGVWCGAGLGLVWVCLWGLSVVGMGVGCGCCLGVDGLYGRWACGVSVVSVMWSVWVGGGGVGALDLVFGCWAGVVVWLCVGVGGGCVLGIGGMGVCVWQWVD